MIARFLALAGLQLLIDLSFVWWFGSALFFRVMQPDQAAHLDVLLPIWPWAVAAVVRIALEFPIRALQKRIRSMV
jgi:hypothetical protein